MTIDELQIEIQAKGAESADGINTLTTSLSALKKTINKSLLAKLSDLSSALDGIKAPITVNMDIKGMEQLKKSVQEATANIPANASNITPTVDSSIVTSEMGKIKASTEQAAGSFTTITSEATKVKKELKGVGSTASDIAKLEAAAAKLGYRLKDTKDLDALRKAAKGTGYSLEKIGESAKKGAGGLSKFVSSLKRIALYRAIRFILKNITSAIKEGTQNLVRYSAAIGGIDASRANETMSKFASTALQVKNSVGAALMPVFNALMPIIQTLADWLIRAANAVNQFFAAVTGATSFTKAKAVLVDYAEGLDGAASAADNLKNAVLGIDELNVLSPSATSGVAGIDYGDMFEEVEIEDKIAAFADKIKPLLSWIKENLESVRGLVVGIGATMLAWKITTSLISSIKSVDTSLGEIGGKLLITAGLAAIVYGAFDAIANGVDWNNMAFMIGGVAAAVGGLALAFGATVAAVGLVVGGAALLAIAFMDINKNGLNLKNTLLAITGMFTTGLGISLLLTSPIPLLIAGLALVVMGIVDVVKNGVSLENSLLIISGIMLFTVAAAIKAVTAGMTTLGLKIGLAGLAVAALVGAFLYISSVWDQLSALEKAATIFTGLAAAVLAAALAIAVFHASWSAGLLVAGIVGSIAAVTVAFASIRKDVEKSTPRAMQSGVPSSNFSPNLHTPQHQTSAYNGADYSSSQYQNRAEPSLDTKEIVALLQQIAGKDTNLYVDGSQMNQALYPHQQQYSAQRGTVLVR